MKIFFNKYKSKIKKFLCTLPVFLVSFALTIGFSVSASTVYKCVYQQPKVDQYSGYVEVITNNNYVLIAYFNVFFRSRVSSTTFEWENISPKFTLTKTSDTRLSLTVSNNIHPDDYKIQTYVSHGSIHTATSGRDELNTTTAELGNADLTIDYFCYAWDGIKAIRVYGPIDYSGIDNSYLEYTGDWVVTYGSDTALYEKLDEVKSSFGGISSSINSNADKNSSQIQSNADKNASAIQSNADKNASDIQANADKNTDIITNGGSDYGTVDKDTSNDYISKEQELDAATSMSRENTVSLFSNFGSFFLNSKLAKGLTGTTAIMKEFLGISWLSDMTNFGLILGAFAFVIGAGVLVGGIHRQKVSAERRSSRDRGK